MSGDGEGSAGPPTSRGVAGAGRDPGGDGRFRMIRRRLVVARRELAALRSEKTVVLALLVQLVVAGFSGFLVVGLTSLYSPGSVSGGGVSVAVTGDAAGEALAAAAEVDGMRARRVPSRERAMAAFEDGAVDAVLVATHEDGRIAATATVPEGSLRKTLIVVNLRELLTALERNERVARAEWLRNRPIPLPPDVPASPYFGFSYTVLVPLLLFLPAFISGSIAVDAVTEEIERGTLDLLRVAPVSLVGIVDGKALAAGVLAPVSAALWLGLLALNGIGVANVAALLVLETGVALALVAAGVGLGATVRNRQRAQLLYSLGILVVFTVAGLLPEHPATTVARLAIGSPGPLGRPIAAGYLLGGLAVAIAVRARIGRLDPERL